MDSFSGTSGRRDPLSAAGVKRLGRYDIAGVVGIGAMGYVYVARDDEIGRPVAIKVLVVDDRLPESMRVELRARFKREARAAGNLAHPNIVVVHDVGEQDGFPYMTMELLTGQTLFEVISEGPIVWREAAEITCEVLDALAYAHARGIVHRDIKPDNVFLLEDGRTKVTDFGIARIAGEGTLSAAGAMVGTPGYMSPEQILGDPVGPATDIFSTGVLFYELMTGINPFDADTPTGTIFKTVHDEPPEIDTLDPDVPRRFREVLSRALKKAPSDRYENALAMKNAIESVLAGKAVEESQPVSSVGWLEVGGGTLPPGIHGGRPSLAAGVDHARVPGEGVVALAPPRIETGPAGAGEGTSRRALIFGIVAACVFIIAASLSLFFLYRGARRAQEKHYTEGKTAYEEGEFDKAMRELEMAGSYSDASRLLAELKTGKRLSEKYNQAVSMMEGSFWEDAYRLLGEIKKEDSGYRDTAAKMHYIEHCPSTPVKFSLADILASPDPVVIPVNNLIGKPLAEIRAARQFAYNDSFDRPDLVTAIGILPCGEGGSQGPLIVLSTWDRADYRAGAQIYDVPVTGRQIDAAVEGWIYHLRVLDVSATPAVIPGFEGTGYPVFNSLLIEASISIQ